MHKWLEHLTHTNIHISPEEEIPQGWDRAICVWKTEHSIQRKTDHSTKISSKAEEIFTTTTGRTTFRWNKTFRIESHHIPLDVGTASGISAVITSWWNVMYTQGSVKYYVGGLDWASTQCSEVPWKEKTRRLKLSPVTTNPQPVVIIGNIVLFMSLIKLNLS